MKDNKTEFLIIGGTTKAATTSLYFYLKEHPQVCVASMKETRFFLDKNYPLDIHLTIEKGISNYYDYFKKAENKLKIDITPDYLYCENTALSIKENLKNVKLVFILREPVSRMVSWYKFAMQNGFLHQHCLFQEYIDLQYAKP